MLNKYGECNQNEANRGNSPSGRCFKCCCRRRRRRRLLVASHISLPLTWQPGSVATNSRKQYCDATSWVAQSCLKGACFSGRVEDPRVACAGSDSSTTWYGHHDV